MGEGVKVFVAHNSSGRRICILTDRGGLLALTPEPVPPGVFDYLVKHLPPLLEGEVRYVHTYGFEVEVAEAAEVVEASVNG